MFTSRANRILTGKPPVRRCRLLLVLMPEVELIQRLRASMIDVQFAVWIGAVSISASARTEHHRAPVDRTSVHLFQVNGAVVDLEGTLVAERLAARRTQNPLLAARRHQSATVARRRSLPRSTKR